MAYKPRSRRMRLCSSSHARPSHRPTSPPTKPGPVSTLKNDHTDRHHQSIRVQCVHF
ncbi:hypothetical protein T492DRAFT_969722 [Pavlovales sp. CCMP2436]|nr:hypothetical protein T492DRAFT_969722 [Pavlovales sp. CCMP2436]